MSPSILALRTLAERGKPRLRQYGVALVVGLISCIAFGAFGQEALPVDDAYIHLSYGLDFSLKTIFSFQDGARDSGTSSWVWTTICIIVAQLRLPEYYTLTALSVLVYSATLLAIYRAAARAVPGQAPLREAWPFLAVMLFLASGNVLWLSLTGMETCFAVLLLLGVVPRIVGRPGFDLGTGVLALTAVLTRLESVVWIGAALMVGIFVRREQSSAPSSKRGWAPLALGVLGYIGYNYAVGGYPMPTSGLSKSASYIPGGHSFEKEWEFVTSVNANYLTWWAPGWRAELLIAAGSAALLLVVGVVRSMGATQQENGRPTPRLDAGFAAVLALFLGLVTHTLLNIVQFRSVYHHARYFAPALFLVPMVAPVFMANLAAALRQSLMKLWPRLAGPASGLFMVLAMPSLMWASAEDLRVLPEWRRLHHQNSEQLARVHGDVARYIRDSLPDDGRIASFDIGVLRWITQRSMVDLGGVTSRRALEYREKNKQAKLVGDDRADLYISLENGWDFVPTQTREYSLDLIKAWQYREYPDPYPPHSKRMVLYRVNHCGEPRLVRRPVGAGLSFDAEPSTERHQKGIGSVSGGAFASWPVNAVERKRSTRQERGRFLASDASAGFDHGTGEFESIPWLAEGDYLSFRLAGGHDPERLRVELRVRGEAIATWTGWDVDSFIEVVHPIAELRGQAFTIKLIDQATAGWGHLLLDEIEQFSWRQEPAVPCPAGR